MSKKVEKKTLQGYRIKISVTPLNGAEFLGSTEQTVFQQSYTSMLAPISILEMAHFQFNKNCFLDKESMSKLNDNGEEA